MLLDPFEEEFDLPAAAVKLGNGERRQDKVVGQEDQRLGGLRVLEANASQRGLVVLWGVDAGKKDGLIADQPGAAVDAMRVSALGLTNKLPAW
jgi:hypothetical protein